MGIERLRDPGVLPVTLRASPWSGRVEVRPFVEARPKLYWRPLPVNSVPIVNMFCDGRVQEHPEEAGYYDRPPRRRQRARAVGELPVELPHVLARALGSRATVVPAAAPPSREYLVSGAVLRTQAQTRGSTVLAFVAFLGVPYVFARNETVLRVTVHHRDDPDHALLARDYRYSDKKTIGAYYNTRGETDLARAGIVHVIDEATVDIVRVVERDAATRRRLRR
ncbi:MAG: hypothetical protein U0168_00860 [Nannocystaceae bacterium]